MEPKFQPGTIHEELRLKGFFQEPLVLYHELPDHLKKRDPDAEIRMVRKSYFDPHLTMRVPVLALEISKGAEKTLHLVGIPHYGRSDGNSVKEMAHYRVTPGFARVLQGMLRH